MTFWARRAGRALVCGVATLGLTAAITGPVWAQGPADLVRDAIVETINGPICSNPNMGKTALSIQQCFRAIRDALIPLVLAESPPLPPPPSGTVAVVTCTYSLDAEAPPLCRVEAN